MDFQKILNQDFLHRTFDDCKIDLNSNMSITIKLITDDSDREILKYRK